MNSRSTLRALLAAVFVATVTLAPAVALADNHCTFRITPANPGWRGATAFIEGFSMTANTGVYVNFNGNLVSSPTATTNSNGYVKVNFTIPNDAPSASNWVVFADAGCQMTDARDYTVLASEPTTTTTTTTTTLPATTTTVAATTTTVAGETTTTVAGATTTTAAGVTTTTAVDTTTTTVADAEGDGGGGIPMFVWVVIAALGGAVVFLLGKMSSRRK